MSDPKTTKNVYKAVLTKPGRTRTGGAATNANAVTLSHTELQRIKEASLSAEEQLLRDEKRRVEEAKALTRAKALEVTRQMREIDRRNQAEATRELDAENEKFKTELQAQIAEKKAEEIDEVKRMTSLANEARAVGVLNQQVQEKRERFRGEFEETKRVDQMLEAGRQRKVQEVLEKEREHREAELRGRKVIIEQIKDNHLKRLKQANEQEEEGQMMLAQIRRLQEEEAEETLQKADKKKGMFQEIMETNHQAIMFKQEQALKEKLENEKIMAYLKEKVQKEEEQARRAQEARERKEREVAVLREKQEKAMDRQQELDQLRAKRMRQNEEKAARQREAEEAESVRRQNMELNAARTAQAEEKQRKLFEQAMMDKAEFEKILAAQKDAKERDLRALEDKENRVRQYREDLQKQMMVNQEKTAQVDRDFKEEGRLICKRIDQEKETIRQKHTEKLGGLRAEGVAPGHTAKLQKTRFV